MNNSYHILLKDVGLTHNINMHTFHCFARSKEEAIGKMVMNRPDFRTEDIHKITEIEFGTGRTHSSDSKLSKERFEDDIQNTYYLDKEFEQNVNKAKELL